MKFNDPPNISSVFISKCLVTFSLVKVDPGESSHVSIMSLLRVHNVGGSEWGNLEEGKLLVDLFVLTRPRVLRIAQVYEANWISI
jgi:hypothetical protein